MVIMRRCCNTEDMACTHVLVRTMGLDRRVTYLVQTLRQVALSSIQSTTPVSCEVVGKRGNSYHLPYREIFSQGWKKIQERAKIFLFLHKRMCL